MPNGGKCRGSMRKKQIWAASIKLVCYFSPYSTFFPLILAYLAIILVFSSNPTQTGKAGYIRENCKEILCNPKLADAPKSTACGGYGDLESL